MTPFSMTPFSMTMTCPRMRSPQQKADSATVIDSVNQSQLLTKRLTRPSRQARTAITVAATNPVRHQRQRGNDTRMHMHWKQASAHRHHLSGDQVRKTVESVGKSRLRADHGQYQQGRDRLADAARAVHIAPQLGQLTHEKGADVGVNVEEAGWCEREV